MQECPPIRYFFALPLSVAGLSAGVHAPSLWARCVDSPRQCLPPIGSDDGAGLAVDVSVKAVPTEVDRTIAHLAIEVSIGLFWRGTPSVTWTLRPFRVTLCWGSSSSHKVVGPFGGVELPLRAPTISGGAHGLCPFWPPVPVSGGSPRFARASSSAQRRGPHHPLPQGGRPPGSQPLAPRRPEANTGGDPTPTPIPHRQRCPTRGFHRNPAGSGRQRHQQLVRLGRWLADPSKPNLVINATADLCEGPLHSCSSAGYFYGGHDAAPFFMNLEEPRKWLFLRSSSPSCPPGSCDRLFTNTPWGGGLARMYGRFTSPQGKLTLTLQTGLSGQSEIYSIKKKTQ